jgi:hypothetical protein
LSLASFQIPNANFTDESYRLNIELLNEWMGRFSCLYQIKIVDSSFFFIERFIYEIYSSTQNAACSSVSVEASEKHNKQFFPRVELKRWRRTSIQYNRQKETHQKWMMATEFLDGHVRDQFHSTSWPFRFFLINFNRLGLFFSWWTNNTYHIA